MPGPDRRRIDIGRRAVDFLTDETGATAIEYAMIAAGISAAIAGTVWNLGSDVKSKLYDNVAAGL